MKAMTFFGLAVFVLSIVTRLTAAAELKVGDAAPTFELKGSDEKLHNLADFKGKKVVVLAWFPLRIHRRLHGGMQIDQRKRRRDSQVRRGLLHGQHRCGGSFAGQ